MKTDLSKVWNNGYGTGYVQARSDRGDITQEEADREIGYINEDIESIPDEVLPEEPEWKYQIREVVAFSKIRREKAMHELLHFAVDALYNAYMENGGEVSVERTLKTTAIVWTRSSDDAEETPKGILTESEKRAAIRGYEANLSFHDIAKTLLAQRNEGIMREMMREIGQVCSKAFKRQMYPIEFYGKLEE